jgi:argininosuccinate lyase
VDAAWVEELQRIGALSRAEAATLADGLEAVRVRFAAGDPSSEPDEDVHSLVERWLREEVGPLASQVRLGRSRNDVVATETRMWLRDASEAMGRRVIALQEALLGAAERAGTIPFPAYTHLQPAQPTRAAAWLLAHFWPLQRTRKRLVDAMPRLNRLPLGSAAGTGTTLAVDRARLAERLGFDGPTESALDGAGGRDWAAEVLWCWTMAAVDLSRLAEDLVVFSTREFGLVRLADAWTTGSSLMPQKRNPDGAELARGAGGVLIGLLAGLLATLKGVPSGYSKDLQGDKEALFEAERRLSAVLGALEGTLSTLEVTSGVTAIAPETLASDLAERLSASGLPFREAHERIARLVRRAGELDVSLSALTPEQVAEVDAELAEGWRNAFDVDAALERRGATGGSSRDAVAAQIAAARAVLSGARGTAAGRD